MHSCFAESRLWTGSSRWRVGKAATIKHIRDTTQGKYTENTMNRDYNNLQSLYNLKLYDAINNLWKK
jgi:hypothetical protein